MTSRIWFSGFDVVGEKEAQSFWFIVQHCDSDPDFQEEVLTEMKKEVAKGNTHEWNNAHLGFV